jgi:hypothetical protein
MPQSDDTWFAREQLHCATGDGANVNAHDEAEIGETPPGAVAATCSYEKAELLPGAGADPTIPGWMPITALQRAKNRKSEEGRKVYELLAKTAREKFRFARRQAPVAGALPLMRAFACIAKYKSWKGEKR